MTYLVIEVAEMRIFDGKRIKSRREALGMSRETLAGDAKTTVPNLYEIEENGRIPKSDLLGRLADALGKSTDALAYRKVCKRKKSRRVASDGA